MADYRNRVNIQTPLDKHDPEQRSIIEYADQLKSDRKWTSVFIAMVQLYRAFKSKDTDVIRQLFPDVVSVFEAEAQDIANARIKQIELEAEQYRAQLEEEKQSEIERIEQWAEYQITRSEERMLKLVQATRQPATQQATPSRPKKNDDDASYLRGLKKLVDKD